MLKHIGLQVIDSDLENFYQNILGGERENSFSMPPEVSASVFNIRKGTDVHYLKLNNLVLELFINNSSVVPDNYSHICLQLQNAEAIYRKAESAGYPVFLWKEHTFFIRDQNRNLFELKTL